MLRTLRGPVFFPVRALAAGYTYTFRGLPLIIVLYLLTLGVPGLRLQGMPPVLVLGGLALVVTYGGYLAEVFRAGIESVHPSQLAAARSLGLTYRQTMRHVVLPQAVRRVAPPLLNDVVALQKDVGLVSLAGPIDAVRAAQIATAQTFNYTPYIVAGVLFVLLAIPLIAVTDWVTLRAARRQYAEADRWLLLPAGGCARTFGGQRGARRARPGRRRAPGGRADRRLRLGQVDPAALREPARPSSTTAPSRWTARTSPTPGSTPTRSAGASAWCSSRTTCSRT